MAANRALPARRPKVPLADETSSVRGTTGTFTQEGLIGNATLPAGASIEAYEGWANRPTGLASRLYFESHVTIEPVFDERLQRAAEIARDHRFRIADLLMQKRKEDTPERSKHDTFMTGRDKSLDVLDTHMRELVAHLEAEGFQVWRAKIEDTLFDTKYGDVLKSKGDHQ